MAEPVFQFGEFELHCGRFQLFRRGRPLRVEPKPLDLLVLLVSRTGNLVTRREIIENLWKRDVFVDTDHSINTAIRKLRHLLRDDSENPRFIETVTGVGYRFIAPVVSVAETAVLAPADVSPAQAPSLFPEIVVRSVRSRHNAWLAAGLGFTALVMLATTLGPFSPAKRIFRRSAPSIVSSLAVLPLDNLSGDQGQQYVADGMTDELITMLAKHSSLRIASRTSVMQFKDTRLPLMKIARALDADGILEGSVSRTKDRVHLTLQLVDANTDAHLWAESYDRDAIDAVTLPREAAETIAKHLNKYVASTSLQRPVNPEAHDAFLRGRYLWWAREKDRGFADFKRATEIQPDYALGWAGLAYYYGGGAYTGQLSPAESLGPALSTAAKAVELDDSQPDAHMVLCGSIFAALWDVHRAEKECLRAIQLDPEFAEAYHMRAKILAPFNSDESIASEKKATELDPLANPWAMARTYLIARRYDDAISTAKQRLESSPRNSSLYGVLFSAYRCKGMEKEAEEAFETIFKIEGDPQIVSLLHRLYLQGGTKSVLRWQIRDAENRRKREYVPPVRIANLYAQLGDREKTLSLLEEAFHEHSPFLLWIQTDPAYDFLHADPRYRSLVQRIGLPLV